MELYEAINKRRSVRAYQDRPVEQDKLDRVLNAGRLAPSARNAQAWKFVVVRSAEKRSAIAEAAEQPFLARAPVIVAVVSTQPERVMHCGIPAGPVDCAIAEGLGTCWIGHFDQDACCRVLGVPPTAEIIELMPLGYEADSGRGKSRKPLDEVVCYESFR